MSLNYQKKSLLWDQVQSSTDFTNVCVSNCFHCYYPLNKDGYFFGKDQQQVPKVVLDYFTKTFPLVPQEKVLDLPFGHRKNKVRYFGKVCSFACGLAYLIEHAKPEEFKTLLLNQALSKGLPISKYSAPSANFFLLSGARDRLMQRHHTSLSDTTHFSLNSSLFQAEVDIVKEPMALLQTTYLESKTKMMKLRFNNHLSDSSNINVLSPDKEEEVVTKQAPDIPKPKEQKSLKKNQKQKLKSKGHKWKF
jgi:hypothetical protein